MKRRKSLLKKTIIFLISVVAIFTVINLLWVILIYNPYRNYLAVVRENGKLRDIQIPNMISEGYENDDYSFTVFKPQYLDFTGISLQVAPLGGVYIYLNDDGTTTSDGFLMAMRIFRNAFGNINTSIDIWDPSGSQAGGIVMVDRNLNIIPYPDSEDTIGFSDDKYYENMRKLLEEQIDTIQPLVEFSYELLKINE